MGAGRQGQCQDFSTLASLSNHRGEGEGALAKSRAYNSPPSLPGHRAAPPPHLTLELALLLEAEVFRGVSHHGEGLLGVVSAGWKKRVEVTRKGVGTSGLLTGLTLLETSSYPWAAPALPRSRTAMCSSLG